MSSHLKAILVAAAAGALAAGVLAGCGSTAATIDPVAQAAVATSRAGGAQMSMHASIEIAGLGSPMTLSASGDFNFASNEGQISSALSGLPSAGAALLHGSSIHFTELYAAGDLYMQSPLFEGKLPNGAHWIKLDLAKLAQQTGLDLQSLTSGQSNPAQVLGYLKASGGAITRLGTTEIRGTRTTHYRASIDLAKAAEKLAGAQRGKLKGTIEKLVSQTGSSTVPVEVWVDSHNLVRKMSLALSEAASGTHVRVALELELFDFGSTPRVNVPGSSEVFDATQTSLSALGGAG